MKKNKAQHKQTFAQGFKNSRALYILLLPSLIIFLLFTYYPMYGVIIAFKDFSPAQGILGSPWVLRLRIFRRRKEFWEAHG